MGKPNKEIAIINKEDICEICQREPKKRGQDHCWSCGFDLLATKKSEVKEMPLCKLCNEPISDSDFPNMHRKCANDEVMFAKYGGNFS